MSTLDTFAIFVTKWLFCALGLHSIVWFICQVTGYKRHEIWSPIKAVDIIWWQPAKYAFCRLFCCRKDKLPDPSYCLVVHDQVIILATLKLVQEQLSSLPQYKTLLPVDDLQHTVNLLISAQESLIARL